MLHIIFWEPEIPGNTGAAIRLSACTGSMLHLVKPLGFDMDDAKLRRAGLDYHDLAHVMVHESLDDALAQVPGRVWALTGHATSMYSDVAYRDGDGLLFGRESVGLSEEAMNHPRVQRTRPHPHARGGAFAQPRQLCVNRPVRGVASAGIPGRRLAGHATETRPGPDSLRRASCRRLGTVDRVSSPSTARPERSTCSASETIRRGFERHIHTSRSATRQRGR